MSKVYKIINTLKYWIESTFCTLICPRKIVTNVVYFMCKKLNYLGIIQGEGPQTKKGKMVFVH